MATGTIFDIKRFAVHDGPGIRTTAFFKGCPLSCPWCHNPEGQRSAPEIFFRPSRCIGCGTCIHTCPQRALSLADGAITLDRERCDACGECAAQQDPESYRDLIVRVAGYSDYFCDLNAALQDEIIARTEHEAF